MLDPTGALKDDYPVLTEEEIILRKNCIEPGSNRRNTYRAMGIGDRPCAASPLYSASAAGRARTTPTCLSPASALAGSITG